MERTRDRKVTSVAWLCFWEEPKAISKAKAWYDILHLETLFLGRVKTGGRDTRKDVSLQVRGQECLLS